MALSFEPSLCSWSDFGRDEKLLEIFTIKQNLKSRLIEIDKKQKKEKNWKSGGN